MFIYKLSCMLFLFFFFKQKTAYEMRISDWSSDVCSSDLEAILNMRLRSLRRLEEMQIRKERDALQKERAELEKLIESPARQRSRLKKDLAALRDRYGPETELGRRRTLIEESGPAREIPRSAGRRVGKEWVGKCKYR